jgi:hypothetical protein
MRTGWQHGTKEVPMLRDVRVVMGRSATILEDAAGVTLLFVLVFAGLAMPGLF